MEYVLIGVVAGSLVVSEHKDKESCLGRAAMLKEQKVQATCVERPRNSSGSTIYNQFTITPGTTQFTAPQ